MIEAGSEKYIARRQVSLQPRLPLEGFIDLTYRCNNNCRHCWVRIPQNHPQGRKEFSFDQIRKIVDQAKAFGCRTWTISGGEPMLREDFTEIFTYISKHCVYYSINTNGSLITPGIAELMKQKGNKWVALYGADRRVHDHITRNPGSFEKTLRGMAYLKEAGAKFTVQIVPMKDNCHQVADMVVLAESKGYDWRINKVWFCLSASGDPRQNEEIRNQRLSAEEIYTIDDICLPEGGFINGEAQAVCVSSSPDASEKQDDYLFSACIRSRRDFHIDPYGRISACNFMTDPDLRYDLISGSFDEAWEVFIPSLAKEIPKDKEYLEGCGSCDLRSFCDWCPVYAHMETGRYGARIDSLCRAATRKKALTLEKQKTHQRFYHLGGLTVQVQADLPITDETFAAKFKAFETSEPGDERILVRHYCSLPDLDWNNLGEEIWFKHPLAVYQKKGAWIYLLDITREKKVPGRVVITDSAHTRLQIFHPDTRLFTYGHLPTLTLLPSDIILMGWSFAYKNACWIHSSGVILDGHGLMFLGPSGAGKSTIVKMLGDQAKLLCDDRNIVRLWEDGFRVHGSWAHGELPTVNPDSAPLKGIFLLSKSDTNQLCLLEDPIEATRKILQCLLRPVQNQDWWDRMFYLIGLLLKQVPVYIMYFKKDGRIVDEIRALLQHPSFTCNNA